MSLNKIDLTDVKISYLFLSRSEEYFGIAEYDISRQ